MRRSGARSLASAVLVLLPLLGGCVYGFAGGGLPDNIRTVAVIPFDNQTPSPDVQIELTDALQDGLEKWLNLRPAPEARADAVVRGTIRRYETEIPIGLSADPRQPPSGRRKLQITVDISLVDQTTGRTLWERTGLVADGQYGENAEVEGRRLAIDQIVTALVEGAQSQW